MIEKLEKKFGKYAIPNLMNYIIAGYIIGYLLEFGSRYTNVNLVNMVTLEPYYIIHGLQLWRLVSWVLLPSPTNIVFAIIMLIFYWQIGRTLEQAMGSFRFNLYIFGGMIFTVIGAFVYYGIYTAVHGVGVYGLGYYFTMDYINLGLFLAFSLLFPDEIVLFWFVIPLKMKWLSIFYGVMVVIEFVIADWGGRTAIISSLLNFLIFFLVTRNSKRVSPGERRRQKAFREQYDAGKNANQRYSNGGFGQGGAGWGSAGNGGNPFGQGGAGWGASGNGGNPFAGAQNMRNTRSPFSKPHVHKCEICGRTEITNPELEFRYCSKCKGNHEYCNDHLFTHKHIV